MKKDIYKTSRICYIIEETTAYFISLLVSGAYLAKLTQALGLSDSLTAILSSLVGVGCTFQLLALAIFRKGRVKKRATALYIVNQLLFTFLYMVPFFGAGKTFKTVVFVSFMLCGYIFFNIVSSPRTSWFMALIPDDKRGRFTAMKEGISLVSGIIFQFLMSFVIDHYEAQGNIKAAFIVCGITLFLLMIVHTLSLIFAKEKEPVETEGISIKKSFVEILSDKNTLSIIGISALWGIASHISIPFYGTYSIKELGFSMTFVAALSMVYAVSRIFASIFLGKYADKYSFSKMLKICYMFVGTGFLIASFMTPANGYITYTLYYLLYAMSMGGINSAEINLIYDCVPPEKRRNTLCVKQTIYGLCSFLATLACTPILDFIQRSGNKLFGISIYGQQVLSMMAFLLIVVLILYLNSHIKRINKTN